jgi:3-oxoacyl-(acyl-carrier-protein) synthase
MSSAVAITGVSSFTPFGVGVDALLAGLDAGQVGVTALEGSPEVGVAKIENFDSSKHANVRGMRVYARATQLEICAAALALADAGLTGAVDPNDLGLVTASSYSHLETLLDYDRGLVTVGMQRTNPTLMPLGLPSAPGAATGLSLPAKAFSITLNDGGGAGLGALGLGARLIAAGRAQVCIVAGAFTVFPELLASASRAGLTSPAERFRVLDQGSAGLAFGEAAAGLVLESRERAAARGRDALGFVRAEASRFAPAGSALGGALSRASGAALRSAGVPAEGVALVCAGANGEARNDAAHVEALSATLGAQLERVRVVAPKANLGESLDASGLLQGLVALAALRSRRAPPIPRLERPRTPALARAAQPGDVGAGAALVTSLSPSGAASALVLSLDAG